MQKEDKTRTEEKWNKILRINLWDLDLNSRFFFFLLFTTHHVVFPCSRKSKMKRMRVIKAK